MGYLDELKKQADEQRAGEQAAQTLQEKREAFYRGEILPRMEATYTYLSQLAEHLNYVKPDTSPCYKLRGFGDLGKLRQSEYEIQVDSRDNMKVLVLQCYCEGEDKVEFTVNGQKAINRYVEYLGSTGLKFDYKVTKDDKFVALDARFTVTPRFPLTLKMQADVENSRINLELKNFEDFVVRSFQLRAEQVNDEFRDHMARYIVREDDNFMRLDVPEDTRS